MIHIRKINSLTIETIGMMYPKMSDLNQNLRKTHVTKIKPRVKMINDYPPQL